jgi:SAM-dependent methyltransferase
MNEHMEERLSKGEVDSTLDEYYWNLKWETNQTGWDIGYASPAIITYLSQYSDKNAKILIAGCGNAYEAIYLLAHNFTNITLIDIAPVAVKKLKEKFANNPEIEIICADFFKHQGQYDLLVEQTFFCAIRPDRRPDYVAQVLSLLKPRGRIIGLLFDYTFAVEGPPFGGDVDSYLALFRPFFRIKRMEKCYNSIRLRAGKEIFINLVKP